MLKLIIGFKSRRIYYVLRFRVQGFKVQGFRVQRFRVALPQYHQIDLFSRSKKYLTAENAENAEVILIFLSQRSPTGA
jgi:hypothetical protein